MPPLFLFARRPDLEAIWPFVPERLIARLGELGEVQVLNADRHRPLCEQTDLGSVVGIAHFGGRLTDACVAAAPNLRMVGGVLDIGGHRSLPVDALFGRDIAVIDATRAWGQSVAECALALALCALRSIPQWHCRMADREPLWTYAAQQFCDNPGFVNGDLGAKRVGVMGLGAIGGRIARWCRALGATVFGYDPFLPKSQVESWGVTPVEMDALVEVVDVVFVAIPPTPSARGILSRERIRRLRRGALVVVITRAQPVDMEALRERILADEVFGAFDVYDTEPLPVEDPLRGRANVVHTPHIAGRTRDANLRAADVIADEFGRLLRGEAPELRLTREAIAVRAEIRETPPIK